MKRKPIPGRQPVGRTIMSVVDRTSSWFTIEQMRERVASRLNQDVDSTSVYNALMRICPTRKFPYRVERIGKGIGARFRFVRIEGTIVDQKYLARYAAEIIPLFDDLINEANKGRTEISLSHLVSVASRLRAVFANIKADVLPPEKHGMRDIPEESSRVG